MAWTGGNDLSEDCRPLASMHSTSEVEVASNVPTCSHSVQRAASLHHAPGLSGSGPSVNNEGLPWKARSPGVYSNCPCFRKYMQSPGAHSMKMASPAANSTTSMAPLQILRTAGLLHISRELKKGCPERCCMQMECQRPSLSECDARLMYSTSLLFNLCFSLTLHFTCTLMAMASCGSTDCWLRYCCSRMNFCDDSWIRSLYCVIMEDKVATSELPIIRPRNSVNTV
mmetsp:Transcript_43054/g.136869  ORF Transcript_43054/g.136869 Transcript_43054/m.136869 type:complete len:227 (+) Transcript_43054:954-1634(+)